MLPFWAAPPPPRNAFATVFRVSLGFPSGSKALPTGPEALPAGSEAFPAAFETLSDASEALTALKPTW